MKQLFLASLLGSTIAMCTAAMAADTDLKTLEAAAKAEGAVNSVGMPDDWANWKGTWEDLAKTYGLKHIDTDMSSAQEIAKFKAEKDNASADIGDVGAAFGPIAVKQEVTQPYKPSTWAQVPDWAKDKDGHWALAYTGTIAFIVNKKLLHGSEVPTTWADLQTGKYKVSVVDVCIAAQDFERSTRRSHRQQRRREKHRAGPAIFHQDRSAGSPFAVQPDHRHHGKRRSRSGPRMGLQRPELQGQDGQPG